MPASSADVALWLILGLFDGVRSLMGPAFCHKTMVGRLARAADRQLATQPMSQETEAVVRAGRLALRLHCAGCPSRQCPMWRD